MHCSSSALNSSSTDVGGVPTFGFPPPCSFSVPSTFSLRRSANALDFAFNRGANVGVSLSFTRPDACAIVDPPACNRAIDAAISVAVITFVVTGVARSARRVGVGVPRRAVPRARVRDVPSPARAVDASSTPDSRSSHADRIANRSRLRVVVVRASSSSSVASFVRYRRPVAFARRARTPPRARPRSAPALSFPSSRARAASGAGVGVAGCSIGGLVDSDEIIMSPHCIGIDVASTHIAALRARARDAHQNLPRKPRGRDVDVTGRARDGGGGGRRGRG